MSEAREAGSRADARSFAEAPEARLALTPDAKRARVARALERFGGLREGVLAPTTTCVEPAQGYRTRAKWVVDREGRVGLYAPGSHDVVVSEASPLLAPTIEGATRRLRALVARAEREPSPEGALDPRVLRGIDLRETVHPPCALLVTLTYERGHTPSDAALARLEEELRAAFASEQPPLDVSVSSAELDAGPRVLGTYRIDPAKARLDRIGASPPFLAAHGSFVQAHRGVAALIHDRVASAVKRLRPRAPRPRVLELYAGSAALGLRLAAEGADVVALERFAPAIELTTTSARLAGLSARFTAVAADARAALARDERFDAIVVNPPRRGLEPEVREAIARAEPTLVAYVSCDPDTLARDLAVLAREGLGAVRVEPFDMMPGTEEVEALALLEPTALPPPRVLAEGAFATGARWVAIDKPPHEPTTPQSEHRSSLLARVQTLPGFERAAPAHRLDLGTSGVCLFGANAEATALLARALAAGEKRYVALVRGVPRPKGIVRTPLREGARTLAATTRYRRKGVVGGHGLLEVRPASGRLHQVRRHLASIGHPVVGDARYGHPATNRHFEETAALDRPFLHAARIALELEGRSVVIEAPLAPDLALVLARREARSGASS